MFTHLSTLITPHKSKLRSSNRKAVHQDHDLIGFSSFGPGEIASTSKKHDSLSTRTINDMKLYSHLKRFAQLSSLGLLVLSSSAIQINAQEKQKTPIPDSTEKDYNQNKSITTSPKFSFDAYILGPGDTVQIDFLDVPELNGRFLIGPDGTLYLPMVRALHVQGQTVEELRKTLIKQFSVYLRDPQVFVRPVIFRPIRIYVGGEVKRPGYYTLTGVQSDTENITSTGISNIEIASPGLSGGATQVSPIGGRNGSSLFPTVFDALRTAQGITPYTDLSNVRVTRKRAEGLGGGRISTELNILSLITEGNESQNIRLYDGDVVNVARSEVVLRDQLLKTRQTNLNPQFINVFVGGRVLQPGRVVVPQGANLSQAIETAGGPKLIRGRVEFLRFTREGEIDRRVFSYNPSAANDDYRNPVLMSGDVIRVRESPL